jgi:hypothetical protein
MNNKIVGGRGIEVHEGVALTSTIIPQHLSDPMVGVLRLHAGQIESFNGSNWILYQQAPVVVFVGLDSKTCVTLAWVEAQRELENHQAALMETHPELRAARAAVVKAAANLNMLTKIATGTS